MCHRAAIMTGPVIGTFLFTNREECIIKETDRSKVVSVGFGVLTFATQTLALLTVE